MRHGFWVVRGVLKTVKVKPEGLRGVSDRSVCPDSLESRMEPRDVLARGWGVSCVDLLFPRAHVASPVSRKDPLGSHYALDEVELIDGVEPCRLLQGQGDNNSRQARGRGLDHRQGVMAGGEEGRP